MLYPLTFHPIFKERVWGGRKLEQLYGKPLPPDEPIGESWEITDRPEGVSVIANGALAGKDLHWLMEHHEKELLGHRASLPARFPLLIKILDARERLSVQVHPPAAVAEQLGGEAKTEMWYIADAAPDAELFVGLKQGVTRAEFERRVKDGSVAQCVHRLAVKSGDAIFLPSGRIHAIGAGLVIFEIQQNSDTTYRVFDWNRLGLDGKPRQLHIQQSLTSIDFHDFEPSLIETKYTAQNNIQVRSLVDDPLFRVDALQAGEGQRYHLRSPGLQIIGLLRGTLGIRSAEETLRLEAGGFALLPASLEQVILTAETSIEWLQVRLGAGSKA
jgi:mannose-6-phosphate isomerase